MLCWNFATDCEIEKKLKSSSFNLFRWTAMGKQGWYLMFLRLSPSIVMINTGVMFTHAVARLWTDQSRQLAPRAITYINTSNRCVTQNINTWWWRHETISNTFNIIIFMSLTDQEDLTVQLLQNIQILHRSLLTETPSLAIVWTHAHSDKTFI